MKFGKFLRFNVIPQWRDEFIDYSVLKKFIPKRKKLAHQTAFEWTDEETSGWAVGGKLYTEFREALVAQVRKAQLFAKRVSRATRRTFGILRDRVHMLRLRGEVPLAVRDQVKLTVPHLYREMENIKSFCSLNRVAVDKILKKLFKYAPVDESSFIAIRSTMLQPIRSAASEIASLQLDVETFHSILFSEGNRAKSQRILTRPFRASTKQSFWLGVFTGFCVPLLLLSVFVAGVLPPPGIDSIPNFFDVFTTYRAMASITFAVWMWGLVVFIWRRSRLNYIYLLQLDALSITTPIQIWTLAAVLSFIWLLFFMLFVGSEKGSLNFGIPTRWYPLAMVCLLMLILAMPFNVLARSARVCFIKTLAHSVIAPCGKVRFRDFLMADFITSLVKPLVDVATTMCFFVSGDYLDLRISTCQSVDMILPPIVAILPYWFRLAQCLRKWGETKKPVPHMLNALKYFSCILSMLMWGLSSIFDNPSASFYWTPLRIAWVVFLVISTLYCYFWDVFMDWGLMRTPGTHGLRTETLFRWRWVYYWAIVSDLFMRFFWALSITPNRFIPINVNFFAIVTAAIEVFRRSQWCIFRLENEAVNNFEQYRSLKYVPQLTASEAGAGQSEPETAVLPSDSETDASVPADGGLDIMTSV